MFATCNQHKDANKMLFVNKNGYVKNQRHIDNYSNCRPKIVKKNSTEETTCVSKESWLFKGKTLGMLTRRVWVWRGCNSSHRKLPHISANSFRRKKKTSILWLRRSLSFPRVARVSFIVPFRYWAIKDHTNNYNAEICLGRLPGS